MKIKYFVSLLLMVFFIGYFKLILSHQQKHRFNEVSSCSLCSTLKHFNHLLYDFPTLAKEKPLPQKIDEARQKLRKNRVFKREKFFCRFDTSNIKKLITQYASIKFKALGFDATAPPIKIF